MNSYDTDLSAVITVKEASELYGWNASSVYRWCTEGKIKAVKCAGTWLISLRWMIDNYGVPESAENLLDDSNNLFDA